MNTNKSVAFYERGSWYHRTKELQEDYKVKYGKKGGFKTKEEAEESYEKHNEQFIKELTSHHLLIDKEVMLSDYLIYWFEYVFRENQIEKTYEIGVAYVIYNILIPILRQNNGMADIKLKLASTDYFNTILEESSKMSKSAGEKCRTILNQAINDAKIDEYIKRNPIPYTKKYYREKPKIKILSEKELSILLKYSKDSNWYLEILLAVFCGLRKGEIMGLKFSDFDIEKQIVRINRQLVNDPSIKDNPEALKVKVDKYELTEKPPKKDSYRTLRIPKIIIKELKKRMLKLENSKERNKDFKEHDYVSFNEKTGKPQMPNSFNKYLYNVCPKLSISNISVHGLRHTFATILIEQGVPIIKISALLGHANPHTTFEIYCDVMEERKRILAFINDKFAPEEMEA